MCFVQPRSRGLSRPTGCRKHVIDEDLWYVPRDMHVRFCKIGRDPLGFFHSLLFRVNSVAKKTEIRWKSRDGKKPNGSRPILQNRTCTSLGTYPKSSSITCFRQPVGIWEHPQVELDKASTFEKSFIRQRISLKILALSAQPKPVQITTERAGRLQVPGTNSVELKQDLKTSVEAFGHSPLLSVWCLSKHDSN